MIFFTEEAKFNYLNNSQFSCFLYICFLKSYFMGHLEALLIYLNDSDHAWSTSEIDSQG